MSYMYAFADFPANFTLQRKQFTLLRFDNFLINNDVSRKLTSHRVYFPFEKRFTCSENTIISSQDNK